MAIRTKHIVYLICIAGGYLVFLLMNKITPAYHFTCISRLLTDIPCPGCGMGRATLALSQGDIITSLRYHILAIPFSLSILIATGWIIKDLLTAENSFFPFLQKLNAPPVKWILLVVILASWALNIYRGI